MLGLASFAEQTSVVYSGVEFSGPGATLNILHVSSAQTFGGGERKSPAVRSAATGGTGGT